MNIDIRKIDINEVAALSSLAKKIFNHTFKDTCSAEDMRNFLQENYNEEVLVQELSRSEYNYYFAEDYSHWPGTKKYKALELKRIYILPEHQGKGVAQALMDFYTNYATTNGYEVIWLGVWEHNYKAQAFYSKYGFVNSGFTHDFPIGNTPQTDVWMWKFLDNTNST